MTGLNHGNILPHHRANFETTEAAMIRFSGLVQALEIVADGITEAEPKSSAGWCAFYALTNELIDKMDACETVRLVEPVTTLSVAEIVVWPWPTPVAKPCEPAALLMVATPPADEAHVTCVVRFCVVPSE